MFLSWCGRGKGTCIHVQTTCVCVHVCAEVGKGDGDAMNGGSGLYYMGGGGVAG